MPVYSHVDRMVALGCMPVHETVSIDKRLDVWANYGTKYFLERREIGIFNIGGGAGTITADGEASHLGVKDCLYITPEPKMFPLPAIIRNPPAKFFMVSTPAHCRYETKLITITEAVKCTLDSLGNCNKRGNQSIYLSQCSENLPALHGHDGVGTGQ